jgi:hypothetical protein
LGGQQVTVSELAFSPDGSLLATRSAEAKINVWQITIPEAGTPSFTLRTTIASDAYVGNLVLSPDNKYLASTGSVAEITLWGVPDGKNYSLKPSIPDEMLYAVAFSKTSNVLATMFENEIQFWGLTPSYKSQYYTRATQDTFVDTPPLPISTAGDIEKLNQVSIGGMLSLDQAASQLQFPLLVPHRLPESLGYLGATVNPDGSVWLRYVDYHQQSFEAILYVYEKIIGNSAPPTMTVGASALILPLQIATEMGSISADYVQGDWKWSFGFTPPQEGMNTAQSLETWRWDSQSASQRLRWQQAGIFIAMYYLANDTSIHILTNPGQDSSPQRLSSFLNREDLLQIASGMQWYDRADTGFACYVSSGRLLYRISDNIEYTGERMCIKPELVVRRYKQQYISS